MEVNIATFNHTGFEIVDGQFSKRTIMRQTFSKTLVSETLRDVD